MKNKRKEVLNPPADIAKKTQTTKYINSSFGVPTLVPGALRLRMHFSGFSLKRVKIREHGDSPSPL